MVPNANMVRTYCTTLFVVVVTAMNRMQPTVAKPQMKGHLVLYLSASKQHTTT